jgi:hypothetical protein
MRFFFNQQNTSLMQRREFINTVTMANRESLIKPDNYYNDKTDIFLLHKYILTMLKAEETKIKELEDKLISLRSRPLTSVSGVALINNLKEIEALEKRIGKAKNNNLIQKYIDEASPILASWKEYYKNNEIHFTGKDNFSPEALLIIREFVHTAAKYVPLNIVAETCGCHVCPICHDKQIEKDSKIICKNCNIYQEVFNQEAEFINLNKINSSTNNNYANKDTFLKTLECYQGKQKAKLEPEIFAKFNEYCALHKRLKANLTSADVRTIFSKLGFSNHYDDCILFLYLHPDIRRPPPDISEYEELIINDYELFMEHYPKCKDNTKESSLNSHYVLMILLRRHKIKYEITDFNIPMTNSIRISNDRIARKVFNILGWDFEDNI